MVSVGVVVLEDGEGDVPVFIGEFFFQEDFVEQAGCLAGGIAEGAAAEGSEYEGVVAVNQAYPQDGPYFVADGHQKVVNYHSVRFQLRAVHAGYGYEVQFAGFFHQTESIAFLLTEYCD